MIGDSNNIRDRIASTIPLGWFASAGALRDAVFGGLADALAWSFGFIAYARAQTRLLTASDFWIDLFAWDYLGGRFARRENETDGEFRIRISAELLRPRATIPGLIRALRELTGREPVVVEPWDVRASGGYGVGPIGYSAAGHYGSLEYPCQVFIKAFRPISKGISGIAGYGAPIGGYGVGAIAYAETDDVAAIVRDAEIFATIAATIPAGTIGWTQVSS